MRSNRSVPISISERDGEGVQRLLRRNLGALFGLALIALAAAAAASLATWRVDDPSLSYATQKAPRNVLGYPGAVAADILIQFLGLGVIVLLLVMAVWGWQFLFTAKPRFGRRAAFAWLIGTLVASAAASGFPAPAKWPLPTGLGGVTGDLVLRLPQMLGLRAGGLGLSAVAAILGIAAVLLILYAIGLRRAPRAARPVKAPSRSRRPVPQVAAYDRDEDDEAAAERAPLSTVIVGALMHWTLRAGFMARRGLAAGRDACARLRARKAEGPATGRTEPRLSDRIDEDDAFEGMTAFEATTSFDQIDDAPRHPPAARPSPAPTARPVRRPVREVQRPRSDVFDLPALSFLVEPKVSNVKGVSQDTLEQNARLLEGVLDDFGVRGEIVHVRPGPVVTLYELEPAPGIKSSRVIGLADDIARSMSAVACRVAVIPGKNAIGVEMPNARRETVYLRDLLDSTDFETTKARLPLCLGKTIGGEPVVADLARMPHLLVAGTTGSGKSVAINTMILSLLYRLTPSQCRLIMIDPKMLELSTYEGIPHLLTPVVTDPKKAVVALKWTVREMEERYRKMSKVGVRNIDGLNARIAQANAKGEAITRTVQTGFDRETGEAIYEQEELTLEPMPYIVVIIDEMADLMMVAGKDIEGAVQRLAQMARAAGIHVVMATQRPSVDVITGTIKANFPTRISFQVTSKIDSRTILGEQGAEQLLGQGDMLYMMGGGRIQRVHGPFVSDDEVEKVVGHLKLQGAPDYLESITADEEEIGDPVDGGAGGGGEEDGEESNDLYDRAVAVVLRDRKASTSYIQRRLQIGYNRAASLIERMEKEGLVGRANHAGKREILVETGNEEAF